MKHSYFRGRRYSVAVRVGDGVRRWSEWSAASQPFLFAVAPPQAQPGARLELHELSGKLVRGRGRMPGEQQHESKKLVRTSKDFPGST